MSKAIIFWLAVLFLFSGAAVVWSALKLVEQRDQESAVVMLDQAPQGVDWIKEFRLTERSGKKFGSEDLKGSVWVASFFYASCPGTCRQQNLELMALQSKYAKQGVKFVSITCDPKTDTLPKLREYADSFQARPDAWFFLTGDIKYLQRIGAEYFQVAVREAMHSDRFMIVDKWGNVRAHIDWKNPIARTEMDDIIQQLTAEQSPPASFSLIVPGQVNVPVKGAEEALDETNAEVDDDREHEIKDDNQPAIGAAAEENAKDLQSVESSQ